MFDDEITVSVYVEEFDGISDNFKVCLLDVIIDTYEEDAAELFGEHKKVREGDCPTKHGARVVICRT